MLTQPTSDQPQINYLAPLPDPLEIMQNQLQNQIVKLSPYKAPGPDGIPDIVLKECVELLTTPLTNIFNAIIQLNTYYDPWREFTTIVLIKLSKPSYNSPKAYCPIALISTTAKLLMALIADNLSTITEHHQLLPTNHFSGQPRHSTSDAIQYLTQKIHKAWNNNKFASVLF